MSSGQPSNPVLSHWSGGTEKDTQHTLRRLAEMSHCCKEHGRQQSHRGRGGGRQPSLRDRHQAVSGERGTLCWADRLLCRAYRPELEEREETAAREAQATGRSQHSTTGMQSMETTWVSHSPQRPSSHGAPRMGQLPTLWKSRCVQGVLFLLITRKSKSVTAAQASPVSASSTCLLQQPWRIPRACFTLCSAAQ